MQPDAFAEVVAMAIKSAIAPLQARIAALEIDKAQSAAIAAGAADTIGAMRERIATLEAREPIAGPPGPAGLDGKAGADGLGFDQLTVTHDGRRTLTFSCASGDRVRDVGRVVLPIPISEGRYLSGKAYEYGDLVTHDRSTWQCVKGTSTCPGTAAGAGYWLQWAARGDRGRDGRVS